MTDFAKNRNKLHAEIDRVGLFLLLQLEFSNFIICFQIGISEYISFPFPLSSY